MNRWRVHFKKKKAPKAPLRLIRAMTEGETPWRPVTLSHLEHGGDNDDDNGSGDTSVPGVARLRRQRHVTKDYDSRGLSDAPRQLTALIASCMDQTPSKRPSFEEALEELTSGIANEVSASSVGFPRQRPLAAASVSELAEEATG